MLTRLFACCLFAAIAVSGVAAHARYARPTLDKTPVDRLVENLQKQLEKKPDDVETRHNLARAYAMAYATKSTTLEVTADRKTGAEKLWFGFEPQNVPFRLSEAKDEATKMWAQEQLDKAIAEYAKVIKADPKNSVAMLGYAWTLDQSGDDMKAVEVYRKVIDAAWEKEKDMKRAGLGWHSLTAEAAGYLTPHLDPKSDAEEIAGLKEKVAVVSRVARPVTPIAIPLQSGLSIDDVSDPSAAVSFDADGSGTAKSWSWITPQAGWLVYDQTGEGHVDSALQMFGNVTFWCFWSDGYRAMASLDDNLDGRLTGDELRHLAVWCDANGNGVSEPGEVKPLADHNIIALSCRAESIPARRDLVAKAGVEFTNGEKRDTFDVILQQK